MVKLGLVVVVCWFAAIDALLGINIQSSKNISAQPEVSSQVSDHNSRQVLEEVKSKCIPGKFYKRGCKRCFCDDKQRPVCGATRDCKLANKYPKNPRFLRTYSPYELQKLPSLSHQSSNCTAGVFYRVDCDACVCLDNNNLMCNDVLCPSYDDVHRIMAKELTGKTCTGNQTNTNDCISCSCEKGKLKCQAKSSCIPTDGRRESQTELPLDLSSTETRQCTKGMVYKRDCNRCFCQKDHSLRCTMMRCLKHTEVQRLKKLRVELEEKDL